MTIPKKLSRPQLHALLMEGWARGIAKHGKGGFADKIEVSGPALDKQLIGSMPGFDCIDKALDHEATVLDNWLHEKGLRLVDREAVCDTDDAALVITRLLLWLQEAEHPHSPGGRRVVHSELLPAETLIRKLHSATGNWIAQIDDAKGPRLVA